VIASIALLLIFSTPRWRAGPCILGSFDSAYAPNAADQCSRLKQRFTTPTLRVVLIRSLNYSASYTGVIGEKVAQSRIGRPHLRTPPTKPCRSLQ